MRKKERKIVKQDDENSLCEKQRMIQINKTNYFCIIIEIRQKKKRFFFLPATQKTFFRFDARFESWKKLLVRVKRRALIHKGWQLYWDNLIKFNFPDDSITSLAYVWTWNKVKIGISEFICVSNSTLFHS